MNPASDQPIDPSAPELLRALEGDGIDLPVAIYGTYRDQPVEARIVEDGAIEFGGVRFSSLSAAATEAVRRVAGPDVSPNRNGWAFWSIRMAEGSMRTLNEVRVRTPPRIREGALLAERTAELLQEVMRTIADNGGSMPRTDAFARTAERVILSPEERTETDRGVPRWVQAVSWRSVDVSRCGWLLKEDGLWKITDEGLETLQLPPHEFLREAQSRYRAWLTDRKPKIGPVPAVPRDEDLHELRAALEQRTGQVWWVNQGANYAAERNGGFIWAPLTSQAGYALTHHSDVKRIADGDTIIHYADSALHAVSIARGEAVVAHYPGTDHDPSGYLLTVEYHPFAEPITIDWIQKSIRSLEAGPFTRDKYVKQGYVFPVAAQFVADLLSQLGVGQRRVGSYEAPSFPAISESIAREGLRMSDDILTRYHLSLQSRRFVILSGWSGSGKTWLAEAYAQAVDAVYQVVPVAPNWTTNEDLLGYLNPLTGTYVDTEFSRFLRDASTAYGAAMEAGRTPRPYHVILDEMNLARVEYYFARFLSILEQAQRPRTDSQPPSLRLTGTDSVTLGSNLYFVGTVNVDETTHVFADKVYDRAQLIEVAVERDLLEVHLAGDPYGPLLLSVWDAVRDVAPFAFRVIDDIRQYVAAASVLGEGWQTALDVQIVQKILPKFHGSDPRIAAALTDLQLILPHEFVLSRSKVDYIASGVRQHGFASFF